VNRRFHPLCLGAVMSVRAKLAGGANILDGRCGVSPRIASRTRLGASFAALIILFWQASAQDHGIVRQKIMDRRMAAEDTDPNAKEMVLTGILVQADKSGAPARAAKEKFQHRPPKEGRRETTRDVQYALWTDDGRRVALPPQPAAPVNKDKDGAEFYYPYPVINLSYYAHGKVVVRVLAIEVSKGPHSAILVKRILDIEQLPSDHRESAADTAPEPEDTQAPLREGR